MLAIFKAHRTGSAAYKRSGLRPSGPGEIEPATSNSRSRLASRGAQPRLKPLSEARMMSAAVKVAVIGLGYVGVPLAAAAAATGADVMGIDIDSGKVESINAGRSPLRGREPGLNELVKATVSKRKFRASLDPAAGENADVVAS